MRKRFCFILAILLIAVAVAAAILVFHKGEETSAADAGVVPTYKCVDNINQMAFNLFANARSLAKPDENIIISPLSVAEALAILSNGGNGQTRDEMLKVLNITANDIDDVNATFHTLNEYLPDLQGGSAVDIANSLWIDKRSKVNSKFIDLAEEYYSSSVFRRNLPVDATRLELNSWCNDKTHGLISEFQKENFAANTSLFVANVLYFNGCWTIPFDEEDTKDAPFYASDKTQNTVKMMYLNDEFQTYGGSSYYEVAILPFGKGEMQMEILLPHEGVSLEQCLKGMTYATWASFSKNSSKSSLDLYMPRMDFDCTTSWNTTLKSLGMHSAFSDKADFSGIGKNLSLKDVRQACRIIVNEQGAKAAAATEGDVIALCEYESTEFNMNHPFAFVIRHRSSGAILFMGCVNKL